MTAIQNVEGPALSERLKVLHDHYKASFSHIREREKLRDWQFMIVIAILGLLFLQAQYPIDLIRLLEEVGAAGVKINIKTLPIPIFTSATWTVFLAFVLRYCQNSITIKRQYEYLHKLEDSISSLLTDDGIYRREGRAYLTEYPAFSKWARLFYASLFPAIVVCLLVYLLFQEFGNRKVFKYNLLYDAVMAFGVLLSFLLYRGPHVIRSIKRIIGVNTRR